MPIFLATISTCRLLKLQIDCLRLFVVVYELVVVLLVTYIACVDWLLLSL